MSWIDRAAGFAARGQLNEPLFSHLVVGARIALAVRDRPTYRISKAIFDFTIGLVLLTLLSPLLIAAAFAVKISSPGPVFFRQLRAGYRANPFWIIKFRTMYEGSEQATRVGQPLEKIRRDPRSTSVGRFLRRRKIDELPQLINVIRGEMSLVGPRPVPLEESATTAPRSLARFGVRPGMTGLWQAMRPNTIAGAKKLAWDARYARKCGWRLDLALLFRTVWVVVRGERDL